MGLKYDTALHCSILNNSVFLESAPETLFALVEEVSEL